MKKIPLRGKHGAGVFALVDDEDYPRVSGYHWYRKPNRGGWNVRGYRPGERRWVYLHVLIMQPPEGMEVDHRDGNTLDNRRRNLRLCTRLGNAQNAKARGDSSHFKGVSLHPRWKRYAARIQVKGRRIELGYFDAPEEAARAYDAAAREHFGEYAALNFPREGERSALPANNGTRK